MFTSYSLGQNTKDSLNYMDSARIEMDSLKIEVFQAHQTLDSLLSLLDSNYFRNDLSEDGIRFRLDSLRAIRSAADTIKLVVRKPNLYFEYGKQKAWLQLPNGSVVKKEMEISQHIDSFLVDRIKGLYLIQMNREGEPVYGGYWNKKSYISGVVQFNDRGKPALIWEKSFGTFRMKEFVGEDE